MASASNSTNLSNNNGAKFPLSVSFSESWTDSLLAANKTRITVSASLKSTSQNWSSNYTSWLRVYWYDDNGNTSSDVPKASASASSIAIGGTISASTSFDVTHKANGTLNGYVYATWTQGSSSGGYCPNNGSVRAPASGTTALQTIAVKPSYNSISATEITSSTVRLKASIDGHGQSITSGGWYLSTDNVNFTYYSGDWADKTITGLDANTKYYYKGTCTSSKGTTTSSVANFTTLKPDKPVVLSLTASNIEEDSFDLTISSAATSQSTVTTFKAWIDSSDIKTSSTSTIHFSGLQTDTEYTVHAYVIDNFNTQSDEVINIISTSAHKVIKVILPTGAKMTPVTVSRDQMRKELDTPDIKVVN